MKLIISFILLLSFLTIKAQNVGIGVDNPEYKLDVGGHLRLQYKFPNNPGILFDGIALPTTNFLGLIDFERIGIKSNVTGQYPFQINLNTGKIGIGNVSPIFDLDVKGRPRIKHTSGTTAGIWFDGVTTSLASFIGTIDNTYMGLFSGNQNSWDFQMNVQNGFIGLGTTPTCRLDVNGPFRLRSSLPKAGSKLTSTDNNGNAEWQEVYAFKATGGLNNLPNDIPYPTSGPNTPTKIFFNQTAVYNYGLSYQPFLSQFIIPENGIYHFETVLEWQEYADAVGVRMILERNGSTSVIGLSEKREMETGTGNTITTKQPSQLILDIKLQGGDLVWVEAWWDRPSLPNYTYTNYVSANSIKTWFTGHLVSRI